ncbi:MAG: GNAT family N-acetyltransferase [Polaromonas sp.]|uniref:GNAT family N-acetyltransferase n=1 Tax=Polaromonas sp. TaxID=1869339 RepID=UPI0032643575
MQIRAPLPSEIEPIRQFLCANGWEHRIGSPEWFSLLVANSQRVAVAVVAGEVVGFARGITDGLSNGYLSMVVVAPEHQRKGVGAALVRLVLGEESGITWVLRAGRPDAPEFFSKLGFNLSSAAMERQRE